MEQKQFDELKNSLETTAKSVQDKVDAMNVKAEAGEKIGKEALAEVKSLLTKHGELSGQLDELALVVERHKGTSLLTEQKMPADQLMEAFEKSADFKDMRSKGKGRATFAFPEMKAQEMDRKATMLSAGVAPGTVIMPQYLPGIINSPVRRTTLLDLIPVSPTNSNSVTYMRESAYNSNAAFVAEGQLKPEDDLTLTQVTAPVQTLATTMRVAKQLLDDLPMLIGYITIRTPQKMRLVKEKAVIYGSGTGGQIQGIAPLASAFAADATLVVPAPNNYDVLGAAILQAQIAEYFPTGIVIHPLDEYKMLHAKDSQNRYLFPEMREGYIGSVPYATSTLADLKGNFLVGDFGLGDMLCQRQGLEIELFDQDRDNVVRNLITIRAEERFANLVLRPDAFVYGNFETAKTDLTS